MQFSKKIKFYRQGIISYEDLLSCPTITNDKQLRQIEFALQDKGTYIEKENIRFFSAVSPTHYIFWILKPCSR